jgi:osmoprotectant transport system permease protein
MIALAAFFAPEVTAQLQLLPARLSQHLGITLVGLGLGIAGSLPLALVVVGSPRLRWLALALAGVVQAIPGLAILALMVPSFVLVRRHFLPDLSAFGFWPAASALTLYSMLPILRNTVTGICNVDANFIEAARGLGMTSRQILMRIQLPLALPMILAGIRTAALWTVGMATLSTPVGQPSLGNYIFVGLQTNNWSAVVVGCIAAALLALVIDAMLGLLESALVARNRRRLLAAALLACLLALAGFWHFLSTSREPTVRIGAKTFSEQYILAEVLADTLNAAGLRSQKVASLGSNVVFDALVAGDIDVYVDYSGTLWANQLKRRDVAPADVVLHELERWLAQEHRIKCLGRLGFENAYALAMRRDRAIALGIETIDDLAPALHDLALGADYEFFDRPEWTRLQNTYSLHPYRQQTFDSSFMYQAVRDGEVDVIAAFSSDGRIAAYDLVVLKDPREGLLPYDAIVLLGPSARAHPQLESALLPLIDAIDDDAMRHANELVDLRGKSRTEAADWLRSSIAPNQSGQR